MKKHKIESMESSKTLVKIGKDICPISLLVVFMLAGLFSTYAQQPQPVYSIVKQLKPYEWYVEQAGLWMKEIKKDDKNAIAWYNYYVANRMANMTGKPEVWENEKETIIKDLNSIVDDMEKAIPESFEFNLVKFWNSGNDFSQFPYLEKAYKIDPEHPGTYNDFITYYEVNRKTEKVDEFCRRWYNSGDVSPGILHFNYNIMMSLDENAIVFTAGDNDTYPLWILQYAKGIRKDVTVLNTSLIFIREYAQAMLKELNIPKFEKETKDFVTEEISKSGNYQLAYNAYQQALIEHIVEHAGEYPIYFSSTTHQAIYEQYEDDLYLEGLAFKYSKENYDNIAVLKRKVEKHFMLDYLEHDFCNDLSLSVVDHTNMNYILPFFNLYEHYTLAGEQGKAIWIKTKILAIAERAGKEKEIKAQFGK